MKILGFELPKVIIRIAGKGDRTWWYPSTESSLKGKTHLLVSVNWVDMEYVGEDPELTGSVAKALTFILGPIRVSIYKTKPRSNDS